MEPYKDLKHIYMYQGDHELWMHSAETWRKNALDKTVLRNKKHHINNLQLYLSIRKKKNIMMYCSQKTLLNISTINQNVM